MSLDNPQQITLEEAIQDGTVEISQSDIKPLPFDKRLWANSDSDDFKTVAIEDLESEFNLRLKVVQEFKSDSDVPEKNYALVKVTLENKSYSLFCKKDYGWFCKDNETERITGLHTDLRISLQQILILSKRTAPTPRVSPTATTSNPANDLDDPTENPRLGQTRTMRMTAEEAEREIYLPPATMDAIRKYGCTVHEVIKSNGTTFYLSGIIEDSDTESRPECLFYALKDGVLYVRMAYKSVSSMKWRVCPKKIFDEEHPDNYKYSKGNYSYTMETAPFTELELAFENLLTKCRAPRKILHGITLKEDPENDSYESEIKPDSAPASLNAITRQRDQNRGPFMHGEYNEFFLNAIKPENTPDSFIPDFTKEPLRKYEKNSYFKKQGKITIELYRVNYEGIDFDFYMAFDKVGRVWIEKIEKSDDEGKMTSTYGTRKLVSPFAPLCQKPIEYLTQCDALNINMDFEGWKDGEKFALINDPSKPVDVWLFDYQYGDIGPILDRIKIIQKYRAAKGITRKTPEQIRQEGEMLIEQANTSKKIFKKLAWLVVPAGAIGPCVALCTKLPEIVKEHLPTSTVEIDKGNWTSRPAPVDESTDEVKELTAANASAIFVIECKDGEMQTPPHMIYSGENMPELSLVVKDGQAIRDPSYSHFNNYEEIMPHPVTLCKQEKEGLWQYPLTTR